jgi:hypothetical protein
MPNRSIYGPFPVQYVKEVLWRTGLIGVALFVMPPFAIAPTFGQLATVYVAIIVWCYYDGGLKPGGWLMAILEACLWLFLAMKWGQLLLLCFGAEMGIFPITTW